MRHEEELKNKIKMLEQERKIKIQEVESEEKQKIKELEETLLRITDDKVYSQAYFFSKFMYKRTKVTNSYLYKLE